MNRGADVQSLLSVIIQSMEAHFALVGAFSFPSVARGSASFKRMRRGWKSKSRSVLGEADRNTGEANVLVAGDLNFNLSRDPAASLIAGTQLDSPFARPGERKLHRIDLCPTLL